YPAKLMDDPDDVLCIFGGLEPEVAVGADRIVSAQRGTSALLAEIHHRVERRADSPGVTMDVEDLSLGRLEDEVVNVTRLLDRPVKRHRRLKRCGVSLIVVGLLLHHLAQWR